MRRKTPRPERTPVQRLPDVVILTQLAAGISREISNPLAYAIGALGRTSRELRRVRQRLEDVASPDIAALAPDLDDLTRLLREATEGATLVFQVARDLSVLGVPDRERRIDPRDALETALKIIASDLRRKARIIRLYQSVPIVQAKESRLVQTLLGLLVNASGGIPPGDPRARSIHVATYTDPNGRAVVEVREEQPHSEVSHDRSTPLRVVLEPAGPALE